MDTLRGHFLAALWLLFTVGGVAQVDSLAVRYANTISQEKLRAQLTILASDSFLGRDTGKEGQKMAAAYIKDQFIRSGIPPVPAPDPKSIVEGYYQPFDVVETRSGTLALIGNGDTLNYGKELVYYNEIINKDLSINLLKHLPAKSTPVDPNINGQAVLVDAEPIGGDDRAIAALRERLDRLRSAGPRIIFVSVRDLGPLKAGLHVGGTRMRLVEAEKKNVTEDRGVQVVFVEEAAMDRLLVRTTMAKLRRKRKTKDVPVELLVHVTPTERILTTENVLAYIEGTDKKDEVVVLTAHYDHVGVENGVVYNGADDDGTGTVAMLGIAAAFAQAAREGHGPRRSILVMPVSGEEKGLLGSRYYSENPVFPLKNTVADLNIDMIGRTDSSHSNTSPYIYVIGSDRLSTELHAVNEQANKLYCGLDLDYRFNAEDDPNRFYYRSDHYNFARKGVPSIFYFSGVHEDYHQPGDDVEKIRFDLLEQRTKLVFHTAWILANRDGRVVVDKPLKP